MVCMLHICGVRFALDEAVCEMHFSAMDTNLNIRQLREARNWTRQEMANYFGVNLTTILRWENNGIPTRGVAKRAIERELAALSAASSEGEAA